MEKIKHHPVLSNSIITIFIAFKQNLQISSTVTRFYETVLEKILVFSNFFAWENASFIAKLILVNVTDDLLLEFKENSHYGDC